jgi:DNA-binding SARP family transcriptional activator
MSTLALRFLGPPPAELEGAIGLKRRKPLALLAWLAVRGERCARDQAADLLYRDLDRGHAFADVRQCLFLPRTALGEPWLIHAGPSAERAALLLALASPGQVLL